jgi:hypothetical protein
MPILERTANRGKGKMVPLYAARIEDLGPGDLVRVECAACAHDVLITRSALRRGCGYNRRTGCWIWNRGSAAASATRAGRRSYLRWGDAR